MRKKLLTLLLAVAASVGTMFAEKVQIGDLYYNLNDTWKQAEVTYKSYTNYKYNEGWGITTANIPASVTYNSVTYSVTSIGDCAFWDCSGLTSVTIPNSVTSIGSYAFMECTGLTSVTIPNSVISIGSVAFVGCTGLTSLTLGNSVTSIGSEAFEGCSSLLFITIPNSVTNLGGLSFQGCSSLISVTIGDGVTSIKAFDFAGCISLTSINVTENNQTYCSIDGVVFDKKKSILILYPFGRQGAYAVPNSVTSIGDGAFQGCTNLTSLIIPNSVSRIGEFTFSDCTGLTSMEIPNSVTNIGEGAFSHCSGLTSITCLAKTPPTIGQYAFSDIGENPKLYVPKESINVYSTADQWKNFYPNIFPITADETTGTAVTATPSNNSVILSWPSVANADTYTIEIRKNGELICTLTFNAQGQLLTLNFAMPARDGHPREVQTALQTAKGWQYTVNGLDPATNYTYTVTAKQGSSVLFTQSVEFHTNWLEPIDNVQSDNAQSTKVLRNGQLFIERNGHTYDAKGQEVR